VKVPGSWRDEPEHSDEHQRPVVGLFPVAANRVERGIVDFRERPAT